MFHVLMSGVHEMDCLGKETVSVSGRSGAQMVTVQRVSVQDVTGMSTVLGEGGGLYQ